MDRSSLSVIGRSKARRDGYLDRTVLEVQFSNTLYIWRTGTSFDRYGTYLGNLGIGLRKEQQ